MVWYHPVNFYISLELKLINLITEQMTSPLMSCHIRHVSWHYKSVCSLPINFYEWVKYPTTTSLERTNGHQTHQTSTHSTTVCGVQCLKHFTNFSRAKNHPRAKKCTAADLGWLATDNDQQSYQRLSRVRFGRWWTLWICEHMMWTGWSHLIWHNFVKVADNWIKICILA